MQLKMLKGSFTIARYPTNSTFTALYGREFCSVTRTHREVTVVCEEDLVPPGASKKEDGWVCLELEGDWDFSITGVLASITAPHSEVSIFAISTFETDYVLVKKSFLKKAFHALQGAGIQIIQQ